MLREPGAGLAFEALVLVAGADALEEAGGGGDVLAADAFGDAPEAGGAVPACDADCIDGEALFLGGASDVGAFLEVLAGKLLGSGMLIPKTCPGKIVLVFS